MAGADFGQMNLYARHGGRKYLNAEEQRRFLRATEAAPMPVRLFSGVLFWGGCRISEALALTANAFDLGDCIVAFETLKRRRRGIVRQVPLPAELICQLDVAFELRAAARPALRRHAAMALEPHHCLAARQAADGGGRGEPASSDAEGSPPRLRRCRVPERGATASRAALARPRLARYHRHLRRRVRPRGKGIRRAHLARPPRGGVGYRVPAVTHSRRRAALSAVHSTKKHAADYARGRTRPADTD